MNIKMCGIWACVGKQPEDETVEFCLHKLHNRGPEGSKTKKSYNFTLGFTRLAINGLNKDGMQPMTFGSTTYVCNGEIYNWKDLASRYNISTESGSDCEVLGELWEKFATIGSGANFFQSLDGVFSILLADTASNHIYVARDPYGVRPLFVGYQFGNPSKNNDPQKTYIQDSQGNFLPIESLYFASEMKALTMCDHIEVFPPGHCAAYNMKTLGRTGFEPYHTVPWIKNPSLEDEDSAASSLRYALECAVKKRMMTDRPVAALLSGGLDSSLIAALVQKFKKDSDPPLKTFSIGFEGSSDLKYARLVAHHIKSDHTEIVMMPNEFFEAIPDVIDAIESYDITTVRASVGNWLVSREIAKRTDCKVVFNGDGSDEVLGGYLYFYNAPSNEAFEAESDRLLRDIHTFDVLRSDRSISSHGLEARTPFLDKQFVAVAKSIPTHLRRPYSQMTSDLDDGEKQEKWILRHAFEGSGLLPDSVLFRRKEAFSDGVSGLEKSWYEECQERAVKAVGDDWQTKASNFTYLMPKTAESYYYRVLYQNTYGKKFEAVTVPYFWMPKWSQTSDPSARTLNVYSSMLKA